MHMSSFFKFTFLKQRSHVISETKLGQITAQGVLLQWSPVKPNNIIFKIFEIYRLYGSIMSNACSFKLLLNHYLF